MGSVPDLHTNVLLRSEQSGGHVSVMENTVSAGSGGPPLHMHDFDEAFYMLEGELVFQTARDA
jgi:quercetin dioxygenase-like cupin family protein